MKKFWMVYSVKNTGTLTQFNTKAEAVNEAKCRQAIEHNSQFFVLEAVSVTVQHAPQIEMQEFIS